MLLIADSGSTKTDWCFVESSDKAIVVKTDGINPIVQTENIIRNIINNQLIPQLESYRINPHCVKEAYFYGAGCVADSKDIISNQLANVFNSPNTLINIESDLLAAARALCGKTMGIACILGTGANSCLYDGTEILYNTPPLGYILGDEGSGAVLGKLFLNAVLKNSLPTEICQQFLNDTHLDKTLIINAVYKKPMANRFLASMSEHILRYVKYPEVEQIVVQNFVDFIVKNLRPYGKQYNTINCVGSIAHYYKPQLQKAANQTGYKIGRIMKSPLMGLQHYHMSFT